MFIGEYCNFCATCHVLLATIRMAAQFSSEEILQGSSRLKFPDSQRYAPATFTPFSHLLTNYSQRLSRPQTHSAAGMIKSMKNSNDTIGNRTRDLAACSAVPQLTASPRAKLYTDLRLTDVWATFYLV